MMEGLEIMMNIMAKDGYDDRKGVILPKIGYS